MPHRDRDGSNKAAAAAEAEAVVLIDEIDLHLHPKWQRQVVSKLTTTFPHCQFIATTHSPQIIGEVEHNRIQIISDSQVYSPTSGFPAINVPMGFTRGGTLPAGLTFFGRAWDEATLLKLTYAYEQATHHRKAPPTASCGSPAWR